MNLRNLCRCGHVRGSHAEEEGACKCGCGVWKPAYAVFDSVLPPGVTALRYIGSTGLTLVECTHAAMREQWAVYGGDVLYATRSTRADAEHKASSDAGLISKFGPPRVTQSVAPIRSWCPFCMGEPHTTEGFTLSVKRLVFAPKEATLF